MSIMESECSMELYLEKNKGKSKIKVIGGKYFTYGEYKLGYFGADGKFIDLYPIGDITTSSSNATSKISSTAYQSTAVDKEK